MSVDAGREVEYHKGAWTPLRTRSTGQPYAAAPALRAGAAARRRRADVLALYWALLPAAWIVIHVCRRASRRRRPHARTEGA